MWAKYLSLSGEFKVSSISIDRGLPRRQLDGVESTLIPVGRFRALRMLALVLAALRSSASLKVVKYFPGCSILSVLGGRTNIFLDIRTLSVESNVFKRTIENIGIFTAQVTFCRSLVVSNELIEVLPIKRKCFQVPLGAESHEESLALNRHPSNPPRLIYVGTFHNRQIETILYGLSSFKKETGISLQLDLVGNGFSGEIEFFEGILEKENLTDTVRLLGYKNGQELENLMSRADFGIVQVPDTVYFSYQPSTKLFEYWSYGLPVLASNYPMNRKYCTQEDSILYDPTPSGFLNALKVAMHSNSKFDRLRIAALFQQYSWSRIVETSLRNALNSGLD
jgi:glycosyltransferase involved in cell wall biosynthesis